MVVISFSLLSLHILRSFVVSCFVGHHLAMLSTLIRHRPATVLGTAPAALLAASSSSTSSLSRPVLLPQFRASSTFSSTAWSLAVSRHAPGPPLSRRRRSLHDSARLGHENPLVRTNYMSRLQAFMYMLMLTTICCRVFLAVKQTPLPSFRAAAVHLNVAGSAVSRTLSLWPVERAVLAKALSLVRVACCESLLSLLLY